MSVSQVLAGLALLLKGTVLYFAFVALTGLFRKKRAWPASPPSLRFAVVIAARNEEAVIGRLVKSLLDQDYPRELFDVFVVPNNCTDDTAGAAFRAGAEILLCEGQVRQKGDALRQAFWQLEGRNYDAYLVFDADNVVDRQYLQKTNDAFCAGAQVVKGRQMALNPRQSWVAGCYDLYFAGFDLLFNLPRAKGDLSAKLVGTGFALRAGLLKAMGGWNTATIAEDAEFAAQCALAGVRVCWAPEAVTYDEQPCDFWTSMHQRKRWCSGVIQVGRKMLPALFRAPCAPLRRDVLLFLLTAQLQPVSLLLLCLSGLCDLPEAGLQGGALLGSLALYWLGSTAFAALLQRFSRPAERRNPRAVLLFPLFMASWMPLQVLALFYKTTGWRAIPHGGQKAPVIGR